MPTIRYVTKRPSDYYEESSPSPYPLERSGVDQCFGCSTSNEKGLGLRFFRYDDGTIETRHLTEQHHWVTEVEGRDIFVEGVLLSTEMVEGTTATSRWRQMRYEPT